MAAVFTRIAGAKGKGVFAARAFAAGEKIMYVKGTPIPNDVALAMPQEKLDHMGSCDAHHCIVWQEPECYINHSCEPNVYEKNRWIIAMRDIAEGEELAFDYAMNGVSGIDDWQMDCLCESASCRKKVCGEFFALPVDVQRKYVPFLDDWFVQMYKEQIARLRRIPILVNFK